MKRLALILAALALLAGCGKDKAQTDGSQPARSNVDTRPPDHVYAFPDEFSNVATKCDDYGNRMYISSADVQPTIVPDPTCGKAGGR